MTRVAVIQFDPALGNTRSNLDAIERHVAAAAEQGAELAILPECAVTGYVYQSREEALEVAEPIPGAFSQAIAAITQAHRIFAVVGALEKEGRDLYNTALLSGPRGLEAVYRKTHTLCLGVDRFTTPGNLPYRVHDLPFGRLGILICYDLRFPEPSRILGLAGAQIIALPTNWPASSTIQPDVFSRARAAENHVFLLAADRVGEERGARFLGRSQIIDPNGTVLAEASERGTETLLQDIDLSQADEKHVVLRAGEHEFDCVADRRPELYGDLIRDPRLTEAR
jgi:predicted amidohydrolase